MISLPARQSGAKFAVLALALGSVSHSLCAQDQLSREITFVRSLAKDMKFIELAKSETDRLLNEFRGAGDQDKIAQLAVEVSYYGARARSDRGQQRELFKEAVVKSQELIDRSADETVKLQAMATLANAAQDFGQFLIEELEIAREETPDKVKDLQEEAATALRAGIEACRKVKDKLAAERSDPQTEIEYHLMWMKQAVLTREQGRADKENRAVLIERSIEELTDMVLDAGEETAIGLRGLFEIAQCYEVGGKVGEAITSYKDTIDQITKSLDDAAEGKLDLSGEQQGFLFDMMQEVYVRAGETMAREGAEGTASLFEKFRETVTKFGEKDLDIFDVVSPTYGHLMLLAESRFLAESGDPQKVSAALAMAKRINDKHPNDYVGVKAKAVLRDILEVQQSLVSGALLFEVGKGELQNQNYEAAVKGLRSALAAMDATEQQKFGLEAYHMLGQAFGRTDRYLEAMLAMSNGLKQFGVKEAAAKTDDQIRLANISSDTADQIDRTVSLHQRLTKDDEFFADFWKETVELAAEYSAGGANKLSYKEGNNFFSAGKYKEAIEQFQQIQSDYLYYEIATVRLGRAQAATGDFKAARETMTAYRKYTEEHELDAKDTGKQQVRNAAMAAAAWNEVQMAYYEARGNEEFKLERNLANYPVAVEKMQAFVANFAKEGEEYLPQALAYLGRLHTDTGSLELAEQVFAQLKNKDNLRASRLATEIFQEYENKVKMLSDELDKMIAAGKDSAAVGAATNDLDSARRKLTALGTDYIASSPTPQLAILIKTMQNWEKLGDWQRVDDVAKKTLALYGDQTEAETKRAVDQLVRPMVGEALLQQKRFQEAYDMLVAAEAANPTQWELKRQIARALGGWFEFSKTGASVKVAGLDRPDEAYQKYYGAENSYRQWAERPDVKKFSLEWYTFMWESYWFARQAGVKDTKFQDIADKFYRIARSTDDFATLKSFGADGERLWRYYQSNRPR